jgi:beta-alanine degradation protein BauB
MSEVGSRKLFENDRVCVWEFILKSGETSPVHSHARDYVLHVLQGASVEMFDKDLKSLGIGTVRTGDTIYYRIEGDVLVSDVVTLPATHAFKNLGDKSYREVLIELK